MNEPESLRLEFRIPISPTPAFYSQVRFFDFALRRLGPPYATARVAVMVGDGCDLAEVRGANAWSANTNVDWQAVPPEICTEFGMHGTANWRLIPPAGDADLVILADADTVLLRDIDPLLAEIPRDRAAVRGHMAHWPPPSVGDGVPAADTVEYWPYLFDTFGVPWPGRLHPYSMDPTQRLPRIPAYFNLGFVAVTPAALDDLGPRLFDWERRFKTIVTSHMRCQILLSLLAYRGGMDIDVISAEYNAANDLNHLQCQNLPADRIRVLHYLRTDELDRWTILLDDHRGEFLDRQLQNPANRELQRLVSEYHNL